MRRQNNRLKIIIVLQFLGMVMILIGLLYLKKDEIKSNVKDIFKNYDKHTKITWLNFKRNFIKLQPKLKVKGINYIDIKVNVQEWGQINGNLSQYSPRKEISCKVFFKGKKYKADLKISRGTFIHWKGNRKSIRLKFKKKKLFEGKIRELKLNIPEHYFFGDYIGWKFSQKLNLITLYFDIYAVSINGENYGLMLGYSEIDKYFASSKKISTYKIMGEKWARAIDFYDYGYELKNYFGHKKYLGLDFKNKPKKDSHIFEIVRFFKIINTNKLNYDYISKFINIDNFIKYNTINVILGTSHQDSHNLKFYYNPQDDKIGFILWDMAGFGYHGGFIRYKNNINYCANKFEKFLLSFPKIVNKRNEFLYSVLKKDLSLKNQLKEIETLQNKIQPFLKKDKFLQVGPNPVIFDDAQESFTLWKLWVKKRYEYLIQKLGENKSRFYYDVSYPNIIRIVVSADNESGIIVKNIIADISDLKPEVYIDSNLNNRVDLNDKKLSVKTIHNKKDTILSLNEEILPVMQDILNKSAFHYNIVAGWGYFNHLKTSTNWKQFLIVLPKNKNIKNILRKNINVKLENKITKQMFNSQKISFGNFIKNNIVQDFENSKKEKFKKLKLKNGKTRKIKKGNYLVDKDINIEKGQKLVIESGVKLFFKENVKFYVSGDLRIKGKKAEKVIMTSYNSFWRGFYVQNSNVEIENLVVSNLKIPPLNEIFELTGSITFYNCKVKIKNMTIYNSIAEDAINFVKSKFDLDNINIWSVKSDALDFDFSSGKIINSNFTNIGGDALDLGSSDVEISKTTVKNIYDKGVSLGENSFSEINNIKIKNSSYGIAVKDNSKLEADDIYIEDCDTGISLYIKKEKFNKGPSANINVLKVLNVKVPVDKKTFNCFVKKLSKLK